MPGQEFVYADLGPAVDEACQQFAHVSHWIDALELAGFDQRRHAGRAFAAFVRGVFIMLWPLLLRTIENRMLRPEPVCRL